jgi:hypothetical protein
MQSIDLVYSVRVVNFETDDMYALRLFSSSPDSHPNAHEPQPVEFSAVNSGELSVRYFYSGAPEFLHAWLFVTKMDAKLGVPITTLAGWGRIFFDALSTAVVRTNLVDVCDTVQAVLATRTLASRRPQCTRTLRQIEDDRVRIYNAMQTRIQGVCARLRDNDGYRAPSPDHSNFYFVETHMQKMPITTFAYLSTFIANTDAQIEALLESLARSVDCANVSITIGEQLVDMCTLLPRALIYTNDMTRSPNGGRVIVDLWSQLGIYPDMNKAGFDCEDGAGLIMSIVYGLRHCKFSSAASPLLRALQTHAKRFTPFFTLGNLKTGPNIGDFVSHAYVTMLDSRWVNAKLDPSLPMPARSELYPALSLESTAYVSGEWDAVASDGALQHSEPATIRQRMVSHLSGIRSALRAALAKQGDAHLVQPMRIFAPTQANNSIHSVYNRNGDRHKGTYQDVYVLMSADHNADRVIHAIVTGDGTIGSLAENLLQYDGKIKLHTVIDQSRTTFNKDYECLWKQEPKNTLPLAPPDTFFGPRRTCDTDVVGIIDVPMRVWNANVRAYTRAFKTLADTHVYHADASESEHELADDLSLMRIYIYITSSK